jgi:hypothetical protein
VRATPPLRARLSGTASHHRLRGGGGCWACRTAPNETTGHCRVGWSPGDARHRPPHLLVCSSRRSAAHRVVTWAGKQQVPRPNRRFFAATEISGGALCLIPLLPVSSCVLLCCAREWAQQYCLSGQGRAVTSTWASTLPYVPVHPHPAQHPSPLSLALAAAGARHISDKLSAGTASIPAGDVVARRRRAPATGSCANGAPAPGVARNDPAGRSAPCWRWVLLLLGLLATRAWPSWARCCAQR